MGLPLVADLDMGYHSVVVVATDSQGLGASNPINLYVNSSAFVHFTHRYQSACRDLSSSFLQKINFSSSLIVCIVVTDCVELDDA